MTDISTLLQSMGVPSTSPVSTETLDSFEQTFAIQLPQRIRDIYAYSNGCMLGPRRPQIVSIEVATKYAQAFARMGIPQRWGYFALTDNNDSNPYCVCCKPPLVGYVVKVSHDDSAEIKFRTVDDLLLAVRKGLRENPRWDLGYAESQFRGRDRTPEDIASGKQLIELAASLTDVERADALRFGMWLLSDAHIADIAALLEDKDSYVREHAEGRLRSIGNAEAITAIDNLHKQQDEFANRCLVLLVNVGIDARID